MNIPSNNKKVKSFIRLNTPRFQSPSSFLLVFWKIVLRLIVWAGNPIVVVGKSASGKSLLLNALTPGKVINRREGTLSAIGDLFPVNINEIPEGTFSIDECQFIEPVLMNNLVIELVKANRNFVFASQTFARVREVIDTYRKHENAKRIVIVVVGGKTGPVDDLRLIGSGS